MEEKKVSGEYVPSDDDIVVMKGLLEVAGNEKGEVKAPVLVSFATKEVIVGWKPEDYERIAKAWHNGHRRVVYDPPADARNDFQPSAPMVEGPSSQAEGAD